MRRIVFILLILGLIWLCNGFAIAELKDIDDFKSSFSETKKLNDISRELKIKEPQSLKAQTFDKESDFKISKTDRAAARNEERWKEYLETMEKNPFNETINWDFTIPEEQRLAWNIGAILIFLIGMGLFWYKKGRREFNHIKHYQRRRGVTRKRSGSQLLSSGRISPV